MRETQGEDGHLQTKEKGLEETFPSQPSERTSLTDPGISDIESQEEGEEPDLNQLQLQHLHTPSPDLQHFAHFSCVGTPATAKSKLPMSHQQVHDISENVAVLSQELV